MARRLGTPLMPWQQQVADVALELDDDGRFVYDEVDLTVPRQSGKTKLVQAKTVHRLVVMARSHGPQRSTYTAQTRLAARKKLERDFADGLRSSRSFPEVAHSRVRPTRPTQWRLTLNNGSESIQFGTGSYWQIDAPSRTGGHGDTLDDGTIDEAFAHETDEVEGSMRPAQATRRDAQLWVLSTAGDGRSKYLWRKVVAGRAATEAGRHGRVAYFEWSADDDADPSDPETWWSCSPALGITITEEFLAGEWERAERKGPEGIDTFRRAYLNQWPEVPLLDEAPTPQVLPAVDWRHRDVCVPESKPADRIALAVDVSPDGESAAIAISDGTHVEVVDHHPRTGWVVDRVAALRKRWKPIVVALDPKGPAGALLADLERTGEVLKVNGTQHAQACGGFYQAVIDHRLRHIDQVPLEVAVAGATKRDLGDAWAWNRRSSAVDISPLVAVTLARWAVSHGEEEQGPSVYEERGMVQL